MRKSITGDIDYHEIENIIYDISEIFLNIYRDLILCEEFIDIGNIFFTYHEFFTEYKDFDLLTPEEIDELLSIEFILIDIKNFSDTVFIANNKNDILIYQNLFTQNLEQLQVNIKNANTASEDCDDGELDFF
jgi:hypothetical protein